MSYNYVSALVKAKGQGTEWKEENVSQKSFRSLYMDYATVILRLLNTVDNKTGDIIITNHRNLTNNHELTVTQWLAGLGNTALPVEEGIYKVSSHSILHRDTILADYNIDRIHPTIHPEVDLPLSEKTDLLITRDTTNYEYLAKHVLVSVNGYLHPSYYRTNGLGVTGGGRTNDVSNNNACSLTSFEDIGEITIIPLTKDMLYKLHPDERMSQTVGVKLPNNVDDKSIMVSIGGYLHVGDNVIHVTGEDTVCLSLSGLNLIQRFYESRKHIDLSSLTPYLQNETNGLITLESFHSDAFMEAYLTIDQSFIILVDTDDLKVTRHFLEHDKIPGTYLSEREPTGLIMSKKNTISEYWAQHEDGMWVLTINHPYDTRYQFETAEWHDNPMVNGLALPAQRIQGFPVHEMIIHSQHLEFEPF